MCATSSTSGVGKRDHRAGSPNAESLCMCVYVFVGFGVCVQQILFQNTSGGVPFRHRRRHHRTIASPPQHADIRAYTIPTLAVVNHLYERVRASTIWVKGFPRGVLFLNYFSQTTAKDGDFFLFFVQSYALGVGNLKLYVFCPNPSQRFHSFSTFSHGVVYCCLSFLFSVLSARVWSSD